MSDDGQRFEAWWTPYEIVDAAGVRRRLMRVRGELGGVTELTLRDADGAVQDVEPAPRPAGGGWPFGFWVDAGRVRDEAFELRYAGPEADEACELRPGEAPAAYAWPLRADRLGATLREHLETREANCPPAEELADFVGDMGHYLRQHRMIYQRPAEHWGDGLILGNGTVGAVATGERGQRQTLHLDRADLWAAADAQTPLGRFYGARLDLRYELPGGGQYLQELDLHRAELTTAEGELKTCARVHAGRDVVEWELRWDGEGEMQVELALSRAAMPIVSGNASARSRVARRNGSWAAITPPEQVEQIRREVAELPHTAPSIELTDGQAVMTHPAPNMTCAVAVAVDGAEVEWRNESVHRLADAKAVLRLEPGRAVTVRAAVVSDRPADSDSADPPAERARKLARLADADGDAHREWWAAFWRRSFIELPDKLVENLWYFGVYHQACFSRSCQACGFFGLWHPLDYRTWDDAYVADAQTALMWWAPQATGHMELMLPSHHTFASMLPEFLEHSRGEGATVPHHFFPEWAGGHVSIAAPNNHKGSVAWMGLNFWRDFQVTGDRRFLAEVAYPTIAALADWHVDDLVRGDDGRLHSIGSAAPEQDDTADDNVYDRACIGAILRAAIDASEALGDESARADRWRATLDDLYDFPADDRRLLETPTNHQPYRCHPVVLFGVYPTGCIEPGGPLWAKADATYDVVTNLLAFHYEDRHASIPGHEGGVEPNGHATAFLMNSAARLRGWGEVRRLARALTARTQLKPNGQRGIADPRHDEHLTHAGLTEAVSGQTAGISQPLVQNYSDHVRLFVGCDEGVFRFAGLRAWGGFVLAGECADGRVRRLIVRATHDGTLRIRSPWPGRRPNATGECELAAATLADGAEAIELTLQAGVTVELADPDESDAALPPAIEDRTGPRRVELGDWDDFDPPAVFYPDQPPTPQYPHVAFLGMPACEPDPPAPRDFGRIQTLAACDDWRARQTAARWSADVDSPEATELLVSLTGDRAPVVAYTAGVSLIRQLTERSWQAAAKIEAETDRPHLAREIRKAVGRAAHSDRGAELAVRFFAGD